MRFVVFLGVCGAGRMRLSVRDLYGIIQVFEAAIVQAWWRKGGISDDAS